MKTLLGGFHIRDLGPDLSTHRGAGGSRTQAQYDTIVPFMKTPLVLLAPSSLEGMSSLKVEYNTLRNSFLLCVSGVFLITIAYSKPA